MAKYTLLGALGFALLAAIGNAIFAFGQKKAAISPHPFYFLIATLMVCLLIFVVTSFLFNKAPFIEYAKSNWQWIVISASGFYLTFIGFYFLYTQYGTFYYALYAILSILTTSIILAAFILKESLNAYHWSAAGIALLAIVVFAIGQMKMATQ